MTWIKVRTDLHDDPAVFGIASALGIPEAHVVGCLVRFWSWANLHTTDGNAVGVTEAWLDRYVSVSGFAQAVRKVGWLEVTEGGLVLPHFDRHMSESAKKRALTAVRVASHREARNAASVTREEERRVEENITPPAGVTRASRPARERKPPDPDAVALAGFHAKAAHHWKPNANVNPESATSLAGFAKLLKRTSSDRVRQVLTWYFRAEQGDYTPSNDYDERANILSGASIERGWDRIESRFNAALRREIEGAPNGRH